MHVCGWLCMHVWKCVCPCVCVCPGSATLHHWQQLAQPHLGVILDARPGVLPKGYRPLELELEQVCMCVFVLPYMYCTCVYVYVS